MGYSHVPTIMSEFCLKRFELVKRRRLLYIVISNSHVLIIIIINEDNRDKDMLISVEMQ